MIDLALDRKLSELRESGQFSPSPSLPTSKSRLVSIYNTTPKPRIDGRFTMADGMEALTIAGTSFGIGIFASAGTVAIGSDFILAARVCGITTITGATIAGLRILLDVFPALIPKNRKLFNQFCDDWELFKEWQLQQRYSKPAQTDHNIVLELHDDQQTRFLHFDSAMTLKAVRFAELWLDLKEEKEYPTGEIFYVGSGKIWSNGTADRQQWNEFKSALIKNRLAFQDGKKWHLTESGRRAMVRLTQLDLNDTLAASDE
jgi:hypothetical protein